MWARVARSTPRLEMRGPRACCCVGVFDPLCLLHACTHVCAQPFWVGSAGSSSQDHVQALTYRLGVMGLSLNIAHRVMAALPVQHGLKSELVSSAQGGPATVQLQPLQLLQGNWQHGFVSIAQPGSLKDELRPGQLQVQRVHACMPTCGLLTHRQLGPQGRALRKVSIV